METLTRFMQFVDRERGPGAGIAFCATEDDTRRADEALNAMSPDEGEGEKDLGRERTRAHYDHFPML